MQYINQKFYVLHELVTREILKTEIYKEKRLATYTMMVELQFKSKKYLRIEIKS